MPKIKVHEKALAHLSRGLYRSPASAIRELVSNAWDANARSVQISTNFPIFMRLRIEDNGDGFSKGEFQRVMRGGIGNSDKRSGADPLKYNRPTIGRLGIGMLAIAQICGNFQVTSKKADGTGFQADVRLYDLIKQKLDKNDEAIVHAPADGSTSIVEVNIGEYDFVNDFDPKDAKQGTVISVDDVHPTFVRSFQESLTFEKYKEPARDWRKALRSLKKIHSLQESGDYWRLLWELAAACPIPYLSDKALPQGLAAEEQQLLESYNFKVVVDGIELKKPIFLQDNPNGYTTRKIEPTTKTVYDKVLKYHGYIVVQESLQLNPDELRGIMIRIKNVGIGYYDQTMLDYRFNEGPRSRWLTGEIFIDEGLEDALNIDRDSFNRFHPQFREVQKHVHDILRKDIFPKVYKEIEKRSEEKARTKEINRSENFKVLIEKHFEKPVRVHLSAHKPKETEFSGPKVKETSGSVEVNLPKAKELPTKSSNQQLAAELMAIFDIAIKGKSPKEQRALFTGLLLKLLRDW